MSADVEVRASVVLKWPLLIDETVQAIGGGPVVLVAMQGQTLCVWTREYGGDGADRLVCVVGTGHLVRVGEHLGSVVAPPYVWHVFEVTA